MLWFQRGLKCFGSLKLVDECSVVIDTKFLGQFNLALIENILNGYNLFVVLHEIIERHGGLKAHKTNGEVEKHPSGVQSSRRIGETRRIKTFVEPVPRPAGRVNLIRLEITFVLQVIAILIDEIPHNRAHVVLTPVKPVLDGRLNVDDKPTVTFSRVHLTNLILVPMLAAIDGREDKGVRVEMVAVELARVGQLENALTDFDSRTVNLIQEEDDGLIASGLEPIRGIERRAVTIGRRQTNKVALGHLRGAPLNDGHSHLLGKLINNLRFANAMASTNQDGLTHIADVRNDTIECLKVYCHGGPPLFVSTLIRRIEFINIQKKITFFNFFWNRRDSLR